MDKILRKKTWYINLIFGYSSKIPIYSTLERFHYTGDGRVVSKRGRTGTDETK